MKNIIYNSIYTICYPLFDFILVFFSIIISYKFYLFLNIGNHVVYSYSDFIPVCFGSSIITILCLIHSGSYDKEASFLNMKEIEHVVKGVTTSFLIIGIILVLGKFLISRYVFTFSYFLTLSILIFFKMILFYLIPEINLLNGFNKRVLIYGAGDLGKEVFRSIINLPKLRIIPVGFIDDDPEKKGKIVYQYGFNKKVGIKILGDKNDILRITNQMNINEIFISITNINFDKFNTIIDYLKKHNINYSFVPYLYKIYPYNIEIDNTAGIPLIKNRNYKINSYYYIKKIVDYISSSLILVLLMPVFLLIAIIIKIDSKGPVFFSHQRVGKNNKQFKMYKFRTMYQDVNPYGIHPENENDSRITKTGKFLRKYSLDELPQIFNIFKGEMSFVGPRPEMKFITDKYDEIQKQRLIVLPGLTGLWQLSKGRSQAIHNNLYYDLYYIHNVSFFLDFSIILNTLFLAFDGI